MYYLHILVFFLFLYSNVFAQENYQPKWMSSPGGFTPPLIVNSAGKMIISGGGSNLYDLGTGRKTLYIPAGISASDNRAFNRDSSLCIFINFFSYEIYIVDILHDSIITSFPVKVQSGADLLYPRYRVPAIHPIEHNIAIAEQGRAQIINFDTKKVLKTINTDSDVTPYIAYSPDGDKLLVQTTQNKVEIFSTTSYENILSITLPFRAWTLSFNPSFTKLMASSGLKAVIADLTSGNIESTISDNTGMTVLMNTTGDYLYSLHNDLSVKKWDGATGTELASYQPDIQKTCMSIDIDGQFLGLGLIDGTIQILEADNLTRTLVIKAKPLPIISLQFTNRISRLHLSQPGFSSIIDIEKNKTIVDIKGDAISAAAINSDGTSVVTGSSYGIVMIWDIKKDSVLSLLNHNAFYSAVSKVIYSPDEKILITGDTYGSVKFWDAASGVLIREVNLPSYISDIIWDKNFQNIFISTDGNITILNAATGAIKLSIASGNGTNKVLYNSKENQLLSVSENFLKVWDARTGQFKFRMQHKVNIMDAAYSPDFTKIISTSLDSTTKVWDATNGRLINSIKHNDIGFRSRFTPDGRRILISSCDTMGLQVRDIEQGNTIALLENDGFISDITFSADGRWILTSGYDGKVKVWDANTYQCLAILSGCHTGIFQTIVTPDKSTICAVGYDYRAYLWNVNSALSADQSIDQMRDGHISASIFPNPVNQDYLWLNIKEYQPNSYVDFTDIHGRQLLHLPLSAGMSKIDISTLANGLYYAQIRQGVRRTVLPVIITAR
jgi:WD40 repeat protein